PPSASATHDPLEVTVETFSEWIVDKTQFKGALPTIPGMELTENLKTKCVTQLPRLKGTTGKDAAELLNAYLEIYGQCAARHNQ
ncbi:hypothetical protein ONO12_28235, partial [Salmonella enterica subsp. enterica serovar Montevideo]|nr:hypothetical protein [Salmonella enterica subsp. enterica serovar Montevideo]